MCYWGGSRSHSRAYSVHTAHTAQTKVINANEIKSLKFSALNSRFSLPGYFFINIHTSRARVYIPSLHVLPEIYCCANKPHPYPTNPISLASVALRTNDVKCKRGQDEKRFAVLSCSRPSAHFNLPRLPVEPKTRRVPPLRCVKPSISFQRIN